MTLMRAFAECTPCHFTGFDCSIQKQLHNGSVSYYGTEYSMVVVHKCDEGYSLIGSSARVCQSSGKWSGEEPFCERENASKCESGYYSKIFCKLIRLRDIVYS